MQRKKQKAMFWSNFKKGNIFNPSDGKPQLLFCEQYLQRKKKYQLGEKEYQRWGEKKNIDGEVKKKAKDINCGVKKKCINGEVKKHNNFLGNFFIDLPSNTNFVSKF